MRANRLHLAQSCLSMPHRGASWRMPVFRRRQTFAKPLSEPSVSLYNGRATAGDSPGGNPRTRITMSTFSVRIALVAISLGAQTAIAFADGPPTLNVGPSCNAAARGAIVIGRDKQACMGDENAALDVLKKNWAQYNAKDKVQCVGNVRTGGPAS